MCVCVCVCVHTWGVVDKSQAVCPQKEALHSPHVFGAAVHTIGFLVLGTYYFTLCFGVIEINAIFVQLCGLALHLLRLKSRVVTVCVCNPT